MSEGTLKERLESSALAGTNAPYIEELYEQYLKDSSSIPDEWKQLFDALPRKNGAQEVSHADVREEFKSIAQQRTHGVAVTQASGTSVHDKKQIQVLKLIEAYRLQGHLHAQIDPLSLRELEDIHSTELSLEDHGLNVQDLGEVFDVVSFTGPREMPLGQLYKALNDTYCGSIGTEFMHIRSPEERAWIQDRIEANRGTPKFDAQIKENIFERLAAAEGLEKYLGSRYPGAKRFSLEGGESLIVVLDELIQRSGLMKTEEVVIGMAHRGRLNVLVNTLGKQPSDLFDEFEGKHNPDLESGDVKYHQGFSSDIATPGGNVHVALAFNPSHLEIVTPVVAGSVRSRQSRLDEHDTNKVLPIAIHGDSAFAGQGVVMETLNMSKTRAYGIGGTIHIVVNNQVGFTTSRRDDTRSTLYCTDVGKVVLAPIFHVNADDPEAVYFVTQMALDYRMRFHKDVIIDLVCYRRHGHNEADEPRATQPLMYKKIKMHPSVVKIYGKALNEEQSLDANRTKAIINANRDKLDKGECTATNIVTGIVKDTGVDWTPYFSFNWRAEVRSGFSKETFERLASRITHVPDGFSLNPRVQKIMQDRVAMSQGKVDCDWGFAETMAYASLIDEGFPVRITGQDVGRGTFFHRHAVLHEQNTGQTYIPVQHIKEDQVTFDIYDSLLSEEAVLAFEYGYATTDPTSLVIWEAQFGDFANGAQVVMDQFISSGQQKWGRLCGLVMLLPHGYEGQGPEHSSARLERYLQLCAERNIQVCVPSNASQVFHMIRRQMLRQIRFPLVVMSPKSLLRHKGASCTIEDLCDGTFQTVIDETMELNPSKVNRVIMCSGKVYYDLVEAREQKGIKDTAIIRIEQLYPFPEDELKDVLAKYPKATKVVWCQEEPKNQGAWYCQRHHFQSCINAKQELIYAGRKASAAPAVGYAKAHQEQQNELLAEAFAQ